MTDQQTTEGTRTGTSTTASRASGEDRWMSDATRELASEFAARWGVARLLDAGTSYHEISERTGASSATISRVNQWLRYGRDGYRLVLDRQARGPPRRRRPRRPRFAWALPTKGGSEGPASSW